MIAVEGRLGRRHAPDPRDRRHLMAPPRPVGIEYRYWHAPNPRSDQGETSMCVEHGWNHYLRAGPVVQQPQLAGSIYNEARKIDEWPGEDYDGTSVRAGAKVLAGRGLLQDGYQWAFDCETVVNFLLTTGPVVLGTNWYRDMFTPNNKTSIVDLTGPNDGGHCFCATGASRNTKLVQCVNSWGMGWAKKGIFCLRFADLDRLIKEDGEACAAKEIKK